MSGAGAFVRAAGGNPYPFVQRGARPALAASLAMNAEVYTEMHASVCGVA